MATKVAILGGGVGGITTAFALTSTPELRDEYDVTVYQRGWRIGGKGASGRNADAGQRIEEHGLHIWFGFYDNAFRLMRECYEELARPKGHPLATLEDAFHPCDTTVLYDLWQEKWFAWQAESPRTPLPVGSDAGLPIFWDVLEMALAWISHQGADHFERRGITRHHSWPIWITKLAADAGVVAAETEHLITGIGALVHHVLYGHNPDRDQRQAHHRHDVAGAHVVAAMPRAERGKGDDHDEACECRGLKLKRPDREPPLRSLRRASNRGHHHQKGQHNHQVAGGGELGQPVVVHRCHRSHRNGSQNDPQHLMLHEEIGVGHTGTHTILGRGVHRHRTDRRDQSRRTHQHHVQMAKSGLTARPGCVSHRTLGAVRS